MSVMVRGVRGATTATDNTPEAVLAATTELLRIMIEANGIREDDVASVFFTTTPDLTAAYPARAARELGWKRVALMGMQEMNVPGGLGLCIRVLIHWNTARTLDEVQHFFLHGAEVLRPDLKKDKNVSLHGGSER